VDSAQVRIFEEPDQVGFGGFLQGQHGRSLEAEVGLEVLGDLADQALEGELPDQEVSRLLVPADFAQSHRARPVPVRLLDAAGGGGALPSSLRRELLAGGLPSRGFTSRLLGTGHDVASFRCVGNKNSNALGGENKQKE